MKQTQNANPSSRASMGPGNEIEIRLVLRQKSTRTQKALDKKKKRNNHILNHVHNKTTAQLCETHSIARSSLPSKTRCLFFWRGLPAKFSSLSPPKESATKHATVTRFLYAQVACCVCHRVTARVVSPSLICVFTVVRVVVATRFDSSCGNRCGIANNSNNGWLAETT
jgi:hypothetical protein